MTIQLKIDLDKFEKWLTPKRVETAFHNAGYEVELKEEYKRNENWNTTEEPIDYGGLQVVTEQLPDRRLCFQPNGISTAYFSIDADIQSEMKEFQDFIDQVEWSEFVRIIGFNEERRCFSFKLNTYLIGLKSSVNICIYFMAKQLRFDKERSATYALKILKELMKESGHTIETI